MEKRQSVDVSRPTGLDIGQCKKIATESRKLGGRRAKNLREFILYEVIRSSV